MKKIILDNSETNYNYRDVHILRTRNFDDDETAYGYFIILDISELDPDDPDIADSVKYNDKNLYIYDKQYVEFPESLINGAKTVTTNDGVVAIFYLNSIYIYDLIYEYSTTFDDITTKNITTMNKYDILHTYIINRDSDDVLAKTNKNIIIQNDTEVKYLLDMDTDNCDINGLHVEPIETFNRSTTNFIFDAKKTFFINPHNIPNFNYIIYYNTPNENLTLDAAHQLINNTIIPAENDSFYIYLEDDIQEGKIIFNFTCDAGKYFLEVK